MAYTEHRSAARVLQIMKALTKNPEGNILSGLAVVLQGIGRVFCTDRFGSAISFNYPAGTLG